LATCTLAVLGAVIAVVTIGAFYQRQGQTTARFGRVAQVQGAGIAVVTSGCSAYTSQRVAQFILGAGIVVIAGFAVAARTVNTALGRYAGIDGAVEAIIAANLQTRLAVAVGTDVSQGTFAAVVAGGAVGGWLVGATGCAADGDFTGITRRGRTSNGQCWIDLARTSDTLPAAKAGCQRRCAVRSGLAATNVIGVVRCGHSCRHTYAARAGALVQCGTRIAVITTARVTDNTAH
jgi:hypothetical protein